MKPTAYAKKVMPSRLDKFCGGIVRQGAKYVGDLIRRFAQGNPKLSVIPNRAESPEESALRLERQCVVRNRHLVSSSVTGVARFFLRSGEEAYSYRRRGAGRLPRAW